MSVVLRAPSILLKSVMFEPATSVEPALNLKTAKALGFTIPETPLATACEVIE
jgi:hypothetical protein